MILFIVVRKIPLTILDIVGHFFQIRSSHVHLNWLTLLQANPRPYGNQLLYVNGEVSKLKCISYIMQEWLRVFYAILKVVCV